MIRLSLSTLLAAALIGLGADLQAAESEKSAAKIKDEKLKKHLVENIDIFGKSELPAIYILGPNEGDIEGAIITRDFSRDPFFMQNIDREEFELGITLRDMEEFDRRQEEAETAELRR